MIYTSGSTGRPKGVMVQQGNVKNFFCGMDQSLSNGSADGRQETWLAVTSVSFDISVLELLWSLRRGSRVVLQSEQLPLARESGRAEGEGAEVREVEFSLFYFAATASGAGYRLLLEGRVMRMRMATKQCGHRSDTFTSLVVCIRTRQ